MKKKRRAPSIDTEQYIPLSVNSLHSHQSDDIDVELLDDAAAKGKRGGQATHHGEEEHSFTDDCTYI